MILHRFAVVALATVLFVGGCSSNREGPGSVHFDDDSSIDDAFVYDTGSATDTRPIDTQVVDTATAPDSATESSAIDADADAKSCPDGVKNGTETDVDCGGADCPACKAGKDCVKASDCETKSCSPATPTSTGKCQPPSCTDGAKNGDETDVDCGGSSCPACADSRKCLAPSDCTSKVCTSGTCIVPTCLDGVANAKETDVDCGGGVCPKCKPGKKCAATTDCLTDLCTLNQCKCPPGMTVVPSAVSAGGSYCIDSTEVTYEQYQKFLDASVAPTSQPAFCSWNDVWTPTGPGAWPYSEGKLPVHHVDWCDAYGYCKWAAKSLCGSLVGGVVAPADFNDHLKDRWYNACSSTGVNPYPYGTTYSAKTCNGAEYAATTEAGVPGVWKTGTTGGACFGGETTLYDMSGDVAEWEDSCSGATGPSDTCRARGGSYLSSSSDLRCDADKTYARDTKSGELGFRCCL